MTTNRPAPLLAAAAPVREPARSATEEQLAHAAAKKLKKQRKAERLRFFLGWCQGCHTFGNSF